MSFAAAPKRVAVVRIMGRVCSNRGCTEARSPGRKRGGLAPTLRLVVQLKLFGAALFALVFGASASIAEIRTTALPIGKYPFELESTCLTGESIVSNRPAGYSFANWVAIDLSMDKRNFLAMPNSVPTNTSINLSIEVRPDLRSISELAIRVETVLQPADCFHILRVPENGVHRISVGPAEEPESWISRAAAPQLGYYKRLGTFCKNRLLHSRIQFEKLCTVGFEDLSPEMTDGGFPSYGPEVAVPASVGEIIVKVYRRLFLVTFFASDLQNGAIYIDELGE